MTDHFVAFRDETLVTLTEAAKSLPGRPHVSTLYRWMTRGVRGAKLETWLIGGSRYTSQEAIDRFIRASNSSAPAELPPAHLSTARQRAIETAEAALRADGI
jgi:hypothetical protein